MNHTLGAHYLLGTGIRIQTLCLGAQQGWEVNGGVIVDITAPSAQVVFPLFVFSDNKKEKGISLLNPCLGVHTSCGQ